MSLPAVDAFTRADAGSLGANWTEQTNGVKIVSNTARGVNDSVFQFAYWSADVFPDDQYAEADIVNVTSQPGIIVRASASGASRNDYWYYIVTGSNILIAKYVAGAFTSLQNTGSAAGVGGYRARLTVEGTTIKAYKDGVQIGTNQTDASLSSGSAGLEVFVIADVLDNWEGGSMVGASAALTGTAIGGITESDVVAGGKVVTITLTGDTWIPN